MNVAGVHVVSKEFWSFGVFFYFFLQRYLSVLGSWNGFPSWEVGAVPGEAEAAELAADRTEESLPSDFQRVHLHTEKGELGAEQSEQFESGWGKIIGKGIRREWTFGVRLMLHCKTLRNFQETSLLPNFGGFQVEKLHRLEVSGFPRPRVGPPNATDLLRAISPRIVSRANGVLAIWRILLLMMYDDFVFLKTSNFGSMWLKWMHAT